MLGYASKLRGGQAKRPAPHLIVAIVEQLYPAAAVAVQLPSQRVAMPPAVGGAFAADRIEPDGRRARRYLRADDAGGRGSLRDMAGAHSRQQAKAG